MIEGVATVAIIHGKISPESGDKPNIKYKSSIVLLKVLQVTETKYRILTFTLLSFDAVS